MPLFWNWNKPVGRHFFFFQTARPQALEKHIQVLFNFCEVTAEGYICLDQCLTGFALIYLDRASPLFTSGRFVPGVISRIALICLACVFFSFFCSSQSNSRANAEPNSKNKMIGEKADCLLPSSRPPTFLFRTRLSLCAAVSLTLRTPQKEETSNDVWLI